MSKNELTRQLSGQNVVLAGDPIPSQRSEPIRLGAWTLGNGLLSTLTTLDIGRLPSFALTPMDDSMGTSAVTTSTIRLDKARGQIDNAEAHRINFDVTHKTGLRFILE